MTQQADKAKAFRALHVEGDPLVLYNIWDAGGAKTLGDAGAKAIATGSWSIAAAHGFDDGEAMPLDFMIEIVTHIATHSRLPLTVDFEGGYAVAPEQVTKNAQRIIQAGAIGINFEDQIVKGEGLHTIADQATRVKAVRHAGDRQGIDVFINARTDLFLGSDPSTHAGQIHEAVERAAAYKDAGADGFFIPGLTDHVLIQTIVDRVSLPVNVMMIRELNSIGTLAKLGVSRVSYGPAPYISGRSDLKNRFEALS